MNVQRVNPAMAMHVRQAGKLRGSKQEVSTNMYSRWFAKSTIWIIRWHRYQVNFAIRFIQSDSGNTIDLIVVGLSRDPRSPCGSPFLDPIPLASPYSQYDNRVEGMRNGKGVVGCQRRKDPRTGFQQLECRRRWMGGIST
jgi:hypothetical protein